MGHYKHLLNSDSQVPFKAKCFPLDGFKIIKVDFNSHCRDTREKFGNYLEVEGRDKVTYQRCVEVTIDSSTMYI